MDVKIGVIGGTGIADPNLFKPLKEIKADTPYGKPSDKISITEFQGINVAFLPRHGSAHTIPPHMVNNRANMYALNELGVERIIGLAAVGSLKEEIRPEEVVIPDQFIDMTKQRKLTFYEGKSVIHVSVADPFCEELRALAIKKARAVGVPTHSKGTYICVEGPRFSTRAESNLWRIMGADIVGMTLVPEAQLARELELCYLSISSVTDYDVWADKPVSAREVLERMKKNTVLVQNLMKALIPAIPIERGCQCGVALKDAGL
jgi:5'-methylthioadenosine phosphorylase